MFLLRSGKGITDYSYQYWHDQYSDISSRLSEIAELVKIGDSATLRIRWKTGATEEIRILGENVFHGQVGGQRYDLLELTLRPVLPHSRRPEIVPSIAIKVEEEGTLNAATADELSNYFRSRISARGLQVVIRSDSWFIDDESYPYVNPFVEAGDPPGWGTYEQTISYYCKPSQLGSACNRSIPIVSEQKK